MRACPLCDGTPQLSVNRPSLPVFQNVTYSSAEVARAAPRGQLALGTCTQCGFSYNAAFDEALVVYDENYDNHVSSAAFLDYYSSLAEMMKERYSLESGVVYDVGCGKGEFLRVLCRMVPETEGVGIDPSCQPHVDENMRLEQTKFDGSTFAANTRLVVLRHVLEHIPEPLAFLKALREAMPDAPLFVEVPDLDWILANGAFWDFCYEHCNYFTLPTLKHALELAGFVVEEQRRSFGDQYQWAVCRPARDVRVPARDGSPETAAVARYADNEASRVDAIRRQATEHDGLVLWGMATKGTMLSLMLDGQVQGGIDSNVAKQGRFAAGSGIEIHAPEWLRTRVAGMLVVMNPNYKAEIEAEVASLNPDFRISVL